MYCAYCWPGRGDHRPASEPSRAGTKLRPAGPQPTRGNEMPDAYAEWACLLETGLVHVTRVTTEACTQGGGSRAGGGTDHRREALAYDESKRGWQVDMYYKLLTGQPTRQVLVTSQQGETFFQDERAVLTFLREAKVGRMAALEKRGGPP